MKTIGIYIKDARPEIKKVLEQITAWAKSNNYRVLFEVNTAKTLGLNEQGQSLEKLAALADPIIALGGDGTLIRVARYSAVTGAVIIGVNFGNLGFLTEILPSEVIAVIENYVSGNSLIASRAMLKAELTRNGSTVLSQIALNDAVILKSSHSALIELDILVRDEDIMRVRSDGLIFATPTGSTAYSLAAGGSIVYPTLSVLLLTPICPHSLTIRPLVLPLDNEYSVVVPNHDGKLTFIVDGQDSVDLRPGDVIKITKAAYQAKFIRSPNKNYFEVLRQKLNWSVANKS